MSTTVPAARISVRVTAAKFVTDWLECGSWEEAHEDRPIYHGVHLIAHASQIGDLLSRADYYADMRHSREEYHENRGLVDSARRVLAAFTPGETANYLAAWRRATR